LLISVDAINETHNTPHKNKEAGLFQKVQLLAYLIVGLPVLEIQILKIKN